MAPTEEKPDIAMIEQRPSDLPSSDLKDLDLNGLIDPGVERKLLWKMDLCIYPTLYVIYVMSFIDRINISNARIQGLVEELDLTGNKFNIALFVYFIPYILFEVPSNMILSRVRPSFYLSGLIFCWGVVNMCMGFIHSFGALVGLRFLLVFFEAGVLPAIIYITALYYKRHEFQKSMSFFFTSPVVAGAFGGLLAYAIANLGHRRGLSPWRWIFIIEGAITASIAIVGVFTVPDWPNQARFLTAEEKLLVQRRLATDGGDLYRMDTLNGFAWTRTLRDYKIWLAAFIYMGIGNTAYAGVFFMPSILLEFGWTAQEAQVHTIPVYVVSAGCMVIAAWASDRTKHRFGFILGSALVATVGYCMLLDQVGKPRNYKFAAIFLTNAGSWTAIPIALGWLQNNLSGHWKRSLGSALQITVGNLSGLVSSNIFLANQEPLYPVGYGVSFAMLWFGAISAILMFLLMLRENKKRDVGERDYRLSLPEEQVNNMGDWHPNFRYTM